MDAYVMHYGVEYLPPNKNTIIIHIQFGFRWGIISGHYKIATISFGGQSFLWTNLSVLTMLPKLIFFHVGNIERHKDKLRINKYNKTVSALLQHAFKLKSVAASLYLKNSLLQFFNFVKWMLKTVICLAILNKNSFLFLTVFIDPHKLFNCGLFSQRRCSCYEFYSCFDSKDAL